MQETYCWLTPDNMFRYRDPNSYRSLYCEDWASIMSYYGDEQISIIYDWLFKRIRSLSWGQYIIIEKDALSLTSNLWLKGKFTQWNIPDPDRITAFKRIAYLMIEWFWRNNPTAVWSIGAPTDFGSDSSDQPPPPLGGGPGVGASSSSTRLSIVPPSQRLQDLYAYFGHYPLAQPPLPFSTQ